MQKQETAMAGRGRLARWRSHQEVSTTKTCASQIRDSVRKRAHDLGVLQALGFSGRVNTAFIERVNLTIRRGVAALARRTWATALQAPHLEAHLQWWLAYYHFVRPHGSLRVVVRERAEETSPGRLRYR